jgi:hypothetical protein
MALLVVLLSGLCLPALSQLPPDGRGKKPETPKRNPTPIRTEFLLDLRYVKELDALRNSDRSVKLNNYAIEFVLSGADNRKVQPFFKDYEWKNAYAQARYIDTGQPVTFDPTYDEMEINDSPDYSFPQKLDR